MLFAAVHKPSGNDSDLAHTKKPELLTGSDSGQSHKPLSVLSWIGWFSKKGVKHPEDTNLQIDMVVLQMLSKQEQ